MNERQCERCGKNITHKPHTIAEDVLDGWIEELTPEEGQEVLISFKNGDIGFDTVYADELGVYFDNGYEWEDVAAWAIPEPYKERRDK